MMEDAGGWVRIADAMSRAGIWSLYSDPEELKAPFYHPYIARRGAPVAGEYQAHWLDAVTWLGFVGRSRECRALAGFCVEDLLAHQATDGYIGVNSPQDQFRGTGQDSDVYEIWSYGETLNALLNYYRQTGERAVLQACAKAADLACSQAGPHDPREKDRGPPQSVSASLATALSQLYRHTGERKYLDMALVVEEEFLRSPWTPFGPIVREKKPLAGHTAAWGLAVLSMIELYRASGDRQWLDYALYAHEALAKDHLQPHGAPSGMGESLAGTGPYVDTEMCDTFWWIWCWTELLKATGEPKYADYAEKAALNALPGQRSKDGVVTAYFMSPNQLAATQEPKTFYPARLYVECCQSNAPRALPLMAENMVLATDDGGLALAFYGSGEARRKLPNGNRVVVRQKSGYPFDESVQVSLDLAGGNALFPLLVRVPAWSRKTTIAVNGEKLAGDWPAGSWARLDRTWADGDRVTINFRAQIAVHFWQRDGQRAAVIERGPLLYALPVRGERQTLDVWGTFEERAAKDSPWNYALMLDEEDPASSVRFTKLEAASGEGHLWENPPVALEVQARRVPDWTFDVPPPSQGLKGKQPKPPNKFWDIATKLEGAKTGIPRAPKLPKEPFAVADEVETIQLVPYGFTLLRMTYLPVATKGR
jgi:DUF1680 family protein